MEDNTPICLDPSLLSMVAFDIETEKFNPLKQRITAAAVYDGNGLSKVFVFKGGGQAEDLALRGGFLSILDSAPRLCSFNGIRFDIPYIIKHWKLDPLLAERWVEEDPASQAVPQAKHRGESFGKAIACKDVVIEDAPQREKRRRRAPRIVFPDPDRGRSVQNINV